MIKKYIYTIFNNSSTTCRFFVFLPNHHASTCTQNWGRKSGLKCPSLSCRFSTAPSDCPDYGHRRGIVSKCNSSLQHEQGACPVKGTRCNPHSCSTFLLIPCTSVKPEFMQISRNTSGYSTLRVDASGTHRRLSVTPTIPISGKPQGSWLNTDCRPLQLLPGRRSGRVHILLFIPTNMKQTHA